MFFDKLHCDSFFGKYNELRVDFWTDHDETDFL